jgi:tetratricopeptide (TPR) repeat protein
MAAQPKNIRLACVLTAALLLSAAPVLAAPEWREVKQPHFGEVLFHFYQENYFSALTQQMTSKHFIRLGSHTDEAELLRGGMLLSYGLHREAGRIFESLIDAGASPPVRDRAWFFLAKIRYQRGYGEEAEAALAKITGVLPDPELEDERRVLTAILLMRREQYAQAIAVLRNVSTKTGWMAYGRYNIGVALIQQGQRASGFALLEDLGKDQEKKLTEERAALRDKANVALAFALLQDGAPGLAKSTLERVRMNGLMSNKALLGLGWAHSALNQNEQALVPWTELSQRAVVDTAVQESLLATPFAFGKLGAYKQALEHYERALDAYTREMGRLDESAAAINEGRLIDGILRDNPSEGSGWFWRLQRLPDTPESRYLAELLATHEFQENLKNYRDLRFLQQNIDAWLDRMQAYRDMLATRRQAYAARLPQVIAGERALQHDRTREHYALAKQEMTRIEQASDAIALANDKELALLQRLERVRAGLSRIGNPAQREAAQEKYRILRGLMEWDVSGQGQYAIRLWEAKKGLRDTERLLAGSVERRDALKRAQIDVPASFQKFDGRIDGLRDQLTRLRLAIDDVTRAQEAHLNRLAVAELARRREQISTYVTQARFAVAQIYDEALRASEKKP